MLACWLFQMMISISVQLWLDSHDFWPLTHQEPDRQQCSPDMDTCRCWAALLWKQQTHGIITEDIGITVMAMKVVLSKPLWLSGTVPLKSGVIVNECVYPFGFNLFFQPGLGPGFFLTLDSSGTFGLRLLFRIAPFRALEGKLKGITPELLTSAIFNDGQWKPRNPPLVWVRIKQFIIWHPVFSTLLQIIFRDDPKGTIGVATVTLTVF